MDSPRKKFTFYFFGTIPEIEKGIKNYFLIHMKKNNFKSNSAKAAVVLSKNEENAINDFLNTIKEIRENENLTDEEKEKEIEKYKAHQSGNTLLQSAREKMENGHYGEEVKDEELKEMADVLSDEEKEVVMDKVRAIVGNGGFHNGNSDLEMYIADMAGTQVALKDFSRMVVDAIDDLTTYIRLEYGVWITPKGELLISENETEREKAKAESADLRTLLDYIKNTPIEDLSWRNVLETLSKKRKNVKEKQFKDEVYFKMMMDIETYAPEATPENPERKLTFEAIGFSKKSKKEIHKLLSK